MKTDSIGCSELKVLLISAFAYLEKNYHILDNLNVFPVPDGDTGVNMLFTMKSGIESIGDADCSSIKNLSEHLNKHVTNNSRGNSGFILARFFHGFTEAIKKHDTITASVIIQAFENGSYLAKTSLSAPKEGTMITIIAASVEGMRSHESKDISAVLKKGLSASREKLSETPKLLPILAKAGVIDSGALGFVFILEGMVRGLSGQDILHENELDYRFDPDLSIKDDVLTNLPFRYCTELMVEYKTSHPVDGLKSFLEDKGDSIALMIEEGIIKLHIHTNDPDDIVNEVNMFGPIVKSKIEDMQEQVNQTMKAISQHEEFTVLAIIPGPGFSEIYKEFGVHHFIDYADNLPSLSEILTAVNDIDSNNIIILPNDKNILPVVTLARDQSEKNIYVLPTKNVIQGIAAMYGFSDMDSTESNVSNMADTIEFATCIKIYKSARDSSFGDVVIRENDYFSVEGDEVLSTAPDLAGAFSGALEKIDLSDKGSVTLYYNEDYDESLTRELKDILGKLNNEIELETYYGGQKKSVLIVSIE